MLISLINIAVASENLYGVIHILRNHQGRGGVWNDYDNVILLHPVPNLITEWGEGV